MTSRSGVEINLLPMSAFDAGTNLTRRPSLARHLIRIKAFFSACAAFGAVQTLKATAQAVMAQCQVAAAIAGKLVENSWNFCGVLIDLYLPGQLKIGPGQLFAMKDGWQHGDRNGSASVECGNVDCRVCPLCMGNHTDQCNGKSQPQTATHAISGS